jgi:cephalosporin-C deacetylase-like acetyl esterase
MSTSPSPVTIPAEDGTPLRGDLYLPEGASSASPLPGLVMSHGFSATRTMALPAFAEAFRDAGIAVCLYDHRNLGDSGGEPRQAIDPWRQTLDMVTVVAWLGARPEVDDGRLGVWGSSFSGGEAIVMGATDPRIKAVVANAPFAGLGDLDPADTAAAESRYRAIAQVVGGERAVPTPRPIGPMPVVLEPGAEGPAFLPQPESSEWFLAHGPGHGWENRFSLSMSDDPPFDPLVCARHVAPAALLLVVAADDRVAPTATALEAYERAREPKQLEVVEGHHFSDYQGPGFEKAVGVMRDFLLAHL